MTLLVYYQTDFDINDLQEIQIVLSIESIKINKIKGKKGDTIKDIIIQSGKIKIDLNHLYRIYDIIIAFNIILLFALIFLLFYIKKINDK